MKKNSILLITAMSCSLSLMSCGFNNLQVPKEVKIKTTIDEVEAIVKGGYNS